jgi:hypothetical protein
MSSRLRRRALLGGLGAAAAGALLRSFNAQAQSAASALPQRLLIIHRPCGSYMPAWWPTGGVTDWVTSPILNPFEPLRDDMVVLKGVDCPRDWAWPGDKNIAGMIAMMTPPPADGFPPLAGSAPSDVNSDSNSKLIAAGDQSIDQLLAANIPGLQGAPLRSLQLCAVRTSTVGLANSRVISYSKSAEAPFSAPLYPQFPPSQAWQSLSGLMANRSSAQIQADQAVTDFLAADLNRLRPRLPIAQIPKVDSYLEALRGLGANVGQCNPPVLPPLPTSATGLGQDEAQYLEVCRQQFSIIKTAFQCDLTRVVTFSFAPAFSSLNFSEILPPGSVISAGESNISADTSATQSLQAIDTFYSQQTANLLMALKSIPEGNGSVLDNTLVVYWNNCSDAVNHGSTDMPVLLFGGKFLKLQGGRFLPFQNRYMSDLWVQTAQAWGYSALTQYGAARWNQGPMPGVYG